MTESQQQKKVSVFVGWYSTGSEYHACAVRAGGGGEITVLKNYIVSAAEISWIDFISLIEQDYAADSRLGVMVFADRCVGYYRINVPPVNDSQLASVVASQAEICLPLPAEQMVYHWRILNKSKEKVAVSIAAAKKEMLIGTVPPAQQAQVKSIVLYSEAVLRSIRFLCDAYSSDFCLLYLTSEGAKLLFVENHNLVKSITFDCDIASAKESLSEVLLLCQDVQNAMSDYACEEPPPLFVFSNLDDSVCGMMEGVLKNKGIEASRLSIPESSELSIPALGAALIAADEKPYYDLFKGLYVQKNSEEEKSGKKNNNIVLTIIASVLLLILVFVSYGADKYRLAEFDKQMNTPEFKQLQEVHNLRTIIAQKRIDVPGLIEKINESVPKGVTVSSLKVQRGQPIAIGGLCKDPKLMYEFEEAMAKHSGVRTVRVTSRGVDEKKKQTEFSLTFDYKTFTQKRKL